MAQKNKALPYIIFGVPLAIGIYFILKSLRKPKGEDANANANTNVEPTKTTTTSTTPQSTYTQKNSLPFKKGDKGGYVLSIQRRLGLKEDKLFGSGTESAVRKFQKENGLTSDGVVGAKTWNALMGADFPNELKLTQSQLDKLINPNVPTYISDAQGYLNTQPSLFGYNKTTF